MMRFMRSQPDIGIPDLYAVSDLPTFVFTEEEWKEIASIWSEYEKKIEEMIH